MAPPVAPKNQTPFDDEISLLGIIQFFKDHFKRILFFIILGGLIGFLYGKLAGPVYEGSVLIAPPRVAGELLIDTNITIEKMNMNSFYSKETLSACNSISDKDKNIDYKILDTIKISYLKDSGLISISLSNKDKGFISRCLNSIENEIKFSQIASFQSLLETKKNELADKKNKIKNNEDQKEKFLNVNSAVSHQKNENKIISSMIYSNVLMSNFYENTILSEQISNLNFNLSSEGTHEAGKILPISFLPKVFPSPKSGMFLGLFLGCVLGLFVSFFRSMKFD